jgi:hypothetical protein
MNRQRQYVNWETWDAPPRVVKDFMQLNSNLLATIFGQTNNVKMFAYSKQGVIIMACLYIYIFSMVASLGWNAGQGSKKIIDINLK